MYHLMQSILMNLLGMMLVQMQEDTERVKAGLPYGMLLTRVFKSFKISFESKSFKKLLSHDEYHDRTLYKIGNQKVSKIGLGEYLIRSNRTDQSLQHREQSHHHLLKHSMLLQNLQLFQSHILGLSALLVPRVVWLISWCRRQLISLVILSYPRSRCYLIELTCYRQRCDDTSSSSKALRYLLILIHRLWRILDDGFFEIQSTTDRLGTMFIGLGCHRQQTLALSLICYLALLRWQ